MYSIDWATLLSRVRRTQPADGTAARTGRFPAVSHTVWALGWTSLFTDVSSEMVASMLPLYLVLHLGMSPLAFGVVDGLYQGAAALVRVAAGVLSDRWRRYKAIAITGYALSAACRFFILLAGASWSSITAIIVADRIGKGIRTAPRDALISQRTESSQLATAFGVHRALDAAGAMLGPVLAFVLLARAPDEFDLLFVTSFAIAVVGVFVIVLFVPAHREADPDLNAAPPSLAGAMSLLTERRFRAILIAGSLLGVATISDAFVYLVLQQGLAPDRHGLSAALRWHLAVQFAVLGAVRAPGRPARPRSRTARWIRRARHRVSRDDRARGVSGGSDPRRHRAPWRLLRRHRRRADRHGCRRSSGVAIG